MNMNVHKYIETYCTILAFTHRLFRKPQEVETAALVHQHV